MFGSVLDTAHRTIVTVKVHANDTTVLQDLWVPVALAFSVFLITLLIALPVTALVAARKEVAVRRAMFLCAMLGNSNTMPLLVMQSLCHSFTPLRDNNRCYATGVEYASLYMTVVNMVAVSRPALQYSGASECEMDFTTDKRVLHFFLCSGPRFFNTSCFPQIALYLLQMRGKVCWNPEFGRSMALLDRIKT